MALSTRFAITCLIRDLSPNPPAGKPVPIFQRIWIFFSLAAIEAVSATSAINGPNKKSDSFNSIRPASMRAMSRLSPMISSIQRLEASPISTSCRASFESSIPRSIWNAARAPCSGVRTSWLIFAKNSLLARFALSACFLAVRWLSSASRSRSSMSLSGVMSMWVPIIRTGTPSASARQEPLEMIQRQLPSRCLIRKVPSTAAPGLRLHTRAFSSATRRSSG